MSFLRELWLRIGPVMETIELGGPAATAVREGRAPPPPGDSPQPPVVIPAKPGVDSRRREDRRRAVSEWSVVKRWFLDDILFVAMLLLALAGVAFRLPVSYWLILTPVFGVISIAEGWSHFVTRSERLGLALRVASVWGALLLAIFLLYNTGVQGVMDANANSLTKIILLALGTFVAGVQARVWQICAVGGILFLAAPGVGWLDQSPLLLAVAACIIIALGGLVWWVTQRRHDTNHLSTETPPR
jgi:hypothetical protein